MNILPTLALAIMLSGPTDTPTSVLDRWLAAINTGDAAEMAAFHRDLGWLPDETAISFAVSQDLDTQRRAGRLELTQILSESDGRIEALVELESVEAYFVLTVATTEGEGWQLGVRRARATLYPPIAGLNEDNLAREGREYVRRVAERGRFSGAVAVAKDGEVLFAEAHGLAHRGFQVPNRTDTKFNLASMGKMFTAVAIARFVDEGKITFDTKVGDVLPDFPNEAVREKVTVRHLLGHTSGVGDIFTEEFARSSKDLYKTVPQWLALFQTEPLAFEPGTEFRYSNGGYCILGAMIEKLAGQEYWAYLQASLFDPLGMKDTGAFEVDRDTPNLAFGYTFQRLDGSHEEGEPVNNLFMHTAKGSPAGGCYSTVLDLALFAEALRSGQLIRPATLDEMTAATGPRSYGLGFESDTWPSDRSFGHGGGFPGISGDLICFRQSGYTVIALANHDLDAAFVSRRLSAMIHQVTGP